MINRISPKSTKYIKLGTAGELEEYCFTNGLLWANYPDIPHQLAIKKDAQAIKNIYQQAGMTKGAASNHASRILSFYQSGSNTLWITFSANCLWWCFAENEVHLVHDDNILPKNSRYRKVIGKWRKTDIEGADLEISKLRGSITKTAGYRQAICDIKPTETEYLTHKINNMPLPEQIEAQRNKDALTSSIKSLIKTLTWQDFEVFVELIFSRSGWQRMNSIGGTAKTLDLDLFRSVPDERAIVQIKSQTSQTQLNKYIEEFRTWDHQYMFFVYHTYAHKMKCEDPRVKLIGGKELAKMAIESGLTDWVIQKSL